MGFRRKDGEYDSISSTYTSLCALFIIFIGVVWIVLNLSSPIFIPEDPIMSFIYMNFGAFVFMFVGGLFLVATRIIESRKRLERERMGY